VDQDNVWFVRFESFETSPYRRLARGASRNGREDVHTVSQRAYKCQVSRSYHWLHQGNSGSASKGGEGALEERISTDTAKLLGKIATGPHALSGGYHDGCDARHILLLDAALL
jgi:hypothetical protein